ncbi:TPA: hypothetical protein JDL67_005042, partial [Salmonella enterica subsp. salamae]|nr:hypothetical protein [Salmonella enterica subsp. salamae]
MKYTVTIMNDSSFVDGHGFVHTWLAYQNGDGEVSYFSFSDNSLYGQQGVFTDQTMKGRPTSRTYPIEITEAQYNKLVQSVKDFESSGAIYDFTPNGHGDYNCTTAALHVLEQAGISTPFTNVKTPFGITNVIDKVHPDPLMNSQYEYQDAINTVVDHYNHITDKFIKEFTKINPQYPEFVENLHNKFGTMQENLSGLLKGIMNGIATEMTGENFNPQVSQALNEMYANIKDNYKYYEKQINNLIDMISVFPLQSAVLHFINGVFWKALTGPSTADAFRVSDPLVIDLNGDGVKTISKSAGIVFDHDGNLFAENTGWISSEDGLLVLDKNQDGKIDSGKELFGGNTELEDGTLAKNGYEALQRYDENKDGVIDKNDSILGKLKIWQDKNTDATVGDGELFSLTKLNIAGIKLDYGDVNATDSEGNKHLHKSEVIYEDGHTGIAEDLGLETDKGKTRYTGDKEVSDDAKVLPYIRGFGNMADLQVAMSHNSDLKALVSQYSVADEAGKFRLTEQIIYAWAGVTGIDIHSRGKNVNAQHLAVLEVTTGEEYRTSYHQKNPNVNDGILLEKEYCKFYGYVSAMLQAQTTYKEFFSKINLTLNKDMSNFTLNFSEVEKYIAGISSQSEALNLRGLLFSLLSYMPQFEDIRNSVGIPAVRDSTGDTAYQGGNNHPDYYFFEKGHGRDVVTDYAGTAAEADTLVFSQAQSGQATFEHTGDDLVIHAYGDDNSVTLKDYFRGYGYRR